MVCFLWKRKLLNLLSNSWNFCFFSILEYSEIILSVHFFTYILVLNWRKNCYSMNVLDEKILCKKFFCSFEYFNSKSKAYFKAIFRQNLAHPTLQNFEKQFSRQPSLLHITSTAVTTQNAFPSSLQTLKISNASS